MAKYLLLLANLYCSLFTKDVVYTKLDDDSDGYANGIENPEEEEINNQKISIVVLVINMKMMMEDLKCMLK